MTARRRFPASVYEVGTEPDPRFTMANERTFLAWSRTALALTAGGVALEVFDLALNPVLRVCASTILILAGMSTPVLAWISWMRTERSLRLGKPLPASILAPAVAVAVTVAAGLVFIASFT